MIGLFAIFNNSHKSIDIFSRPIDELNVKSILLLDIDVGEQFL